MKLRLVKGRSRFSREPWYECRGCSEEVPGNLYNVVAGECEACHTASELSYTMCGCPTCLSLAEAQCVFDLEEDV